MQITELLRLTEWFKEYVILPGIPTQYSALHNRMNQNVNNQKQPFESEKGALIDSLLLVNLSILTLEQIKFLEQLDIKELLGQDGVENIENILFDNNLDIASATIKIGENSGKISTAKSTLNEIDTVLNKSFSIEEDDEISDDSVMMRVYFQDGASIKDLKDLKRLSSVWYDIGRGIAMAQNRTPEDFNIIGAQKGSLIIEMAVYAGLATSISTILLASLKVAERVIDLLKRVEELKSLKLENKQIAQDLKKEADKEKENGINLTLEAAIEQLGLNRQEEGDKITALEKSISKLIDFTQKGGVVDFIQPDEEQEDDEQSKDIRAEISKLSDNVQEIRRIENSIKLLESKKERKN